MNEYKEIKRCAKCGAAVGFLLLGVVGAESLQYHECKNARTDIWCVAKDDMESKRNPYRPINPDLRIGIATTTSAASVMNSDVAFTNFRSLLK